ncbi:C-type lectin domain family 4 member E-like isoform X1 [Oncorhynchus mykiss]|uniref:C-type lectin domain family 4 member E-like isoform X1 n=1 Tax=Oncorhynchus mykiss TaxID=8022 RepID=UPI0018778C97|nr:C-type lectin domain family 4 member E-like isoform X1 [Oncorhynchus mykiss]
MDDHINNQVIEEKQKRAMRRVKTETNRSGPEDSGRRLYRMVSVSFGMLCVLQVTLNISLRLVYNRCFKYSEERDQLQTSYNNLTKERDQLRMSYNNLTKERDQLQTERDFLSRRFTNLIEQTCPEGWQKFESSWYFLSTETKTWNESREDCLKRVADLVIITSDEEQTFLFNLKKRVWIGLTDSVNEGTWKWVDGTPLTTRYWYDPQPDNGGGYAEHGEEHCAEINKVHHHLKAWNDLSCDKKIYFICEQVI